MFDYVRFRYRRYLRRVKRGSRILHKWTLNYIDRHLWGKWHQVRVVRRFLFMWWLLIVIAIIGLSKEIGALNRAASLAVPVSGGTYTEAALGSVQGLNPVLPEGVASTDINRLIYSGLTRYNSRRQLIPDLATSWEISPDGKTYTFHLRKGVKWHDGVPFTSADVAFTLTAIQNPDSRSPLASSWQGVKVEIKDDHTIAFILPTPLNSFLDSTTLGIVPRHLLESIEPSQLRVAAFNQRPVGTGPFVIKTFAASAREIELSANPQYYLGQPKLDGVLFKLYDTPTAAFQAYAQHQVNAVGRIKPDRHDQSSTLKGLTTHSFTLPEETTLFFANGDPVLADKDLRGILSRSLDRPAILSRAAASQGVTLTQPLLPGQTGYTNRYAAASLEPAAAREALEAAGWKLPAGSSARTKDGRKLQFSLATLAGGELERAAREIKRQYALIGVGINIKTADLADLQQTYMRPRNFQMLLYGVNLGADPDVYSYWHSTQIKDPGVNLAGYASDDADKALEAGRIKADPQIRQGKYDTFLKAWNADNPAAVLYQTSYQYGTSEELAGVKAHRLTVPADRFYDVHQWTIKRRLVPAR